MSGRPDCEMCGQPYHRYSPDDPEHAYSPTACINALRYRLADVEAQLADLIAEHPQLTTHPSLVGPAAVPADPRAAVGPQP